MVKKKTHSRENDGKGGYTEPSGGRDDMGGGGEKWCEQESGEHKERPKLQKFNRRPKQRGLFSVRDPSQETQLENRLNRPSKLRNMNVSAM